MSVARAIRVYLPDFDGLHGKNHCLQAYLPLSSPNRACSHLFPPSTETETSWTPCPPENAMPISSTGLFETSSSSCAGWMIIDLVVILFIGVVFIGAVPGATQP